MHKNTEVTEPLLDSYDQAYGAVVTALAQINSNENIALGALDKELKELARITAEMAKVAGALRTADSERVDGMKPFEVVYADRIHDLLHTTTEYAKREVALSIKRYLGV